MTTQPNQPNRPGPIVPGDLFARHQTITGLRALADFLEAHPAIPVEEYGADISVHVRRGTDACQRAEVDRIASLLGSPVRDNTARGGHYVVTKSFGRITYRAVHIPTRAMAAYEAQMSYRDNITTDHLATGRSDVAA